MRLGLLGGTGLDSMPGLEVDALHSEETRWGAASAKPATGVWNGLPVAWLPRHGKNHELPPHAINYRANIQALADLEVTGIVAVAAVGGISEEFTGGSVAVPDDLIDYSWGRAHSFWNDATSPMLHVEFAPPYDPAMRAALLQAADRAAVPVLPAGTYAVTQGPRLETAAEIRRLSRDGCDIVGMTGMPEAALARELGIPYACLAMVVNAAAGVGEGSIHDDIDRHIASATDRVTALLVAYAEQAVNTGRLS